MALPLDTVGTREELLDRRCIVQVRDLLVRADGLGEQLRVQFKVTKTLKFEPNTIELKIFNLNAANRQSLEVIPKASPNVTLQRLVADLTANNVVRLQVGYKSGVSQIYLGEVRAAESAQAGADIVTSLTSGDGEKALQTTRISVPIGAGTGIDVALSAIVRALGCGEGNLATIKKDLAFFNLAKVYPKGGVLHGSTADHLQAFAKSANLEISIQDGNILILDRGRALKGQALVMRSDTGLVGAPTVDSTGIATWKTLMIPDMYPGRTVVFDAKFLKGPFRVDECTYMGDTHGNDWYIECKGKKVKV